MICKGQVRLWPKDDIAGQVAVVPRLFKLSFGKAPFALSHSGLPI